MLDLRSAFENFQPDMDANDTSVDLAFITDFLMPYFKNLRREELEAKVAEVIAREGAKLAAAGSRPR